MKSNLFKSISSFMIIIIMFLSSSILQTTLKAQSIENSYGTYAYPHRSDELLGESTDWTVVYIAGAVAAAGLIYYMIRSAEEANDIEKYDLDSTNTTSALIRKNTRIEVDNNQFLKISKFISETPIKPFIALRQNKILMNNKKTLHVGLVYNF